MDMYGCDMTMLLLMVANVSVSSTPLVVFKRPEFIALVCAVGLCIIVVQLSYMALYPADKTGHTWLVLNTLKVPQPFWRQYPGRDVIYHAMCPVEAFIVIPLMVFFYFGLDGFRTKTEVV